MRLLAIVTLQRVEQLLKRYELACGLVQASTL